MTRHRKILFGTLLVLVICLISAAMLKSIDGGGSNRANADVPSFDERMVAFREEVPLVERLKRNRFGYVSLGEKGDRIEKNGYDHVYEPGYYPLGWGIESINLGELCRVLGCRSEDFRWAARKVYLLQGMPRGFGSAHDLYIERPGQYNCLVWVHDLEHVPEDIKDAPVQALVIPLH